MNKNSSTSKKGEMFVIAGPSGVGKRTLISKLLHNPDLNLVFSVSCTTRSKRFNEVHGVDYFFISKEEFERKIENGDMLEHAQFFNNYYGTDKNFVDEGLYKGKNVLLEIETLGFKQIKQRFPDILSIFIAPNSMEELRNRLLKRGTENEEEAKVRLDKAKEEIQDASLFKYTVINDSIEEAVHEIQTILFSEFNKNVKN